MMGMGMGPEGTSEVKICDIDQTTLKAALDHFFTLIGRNPNDFLHHQGNCNAWEFLNSIYVSNGKEEEFYEVLRLISSWDRTLASAYAPEKLPDHFKVYGYRHLADLFEQIAHDVCIFQHYAPNAQKLGLGYRWYNRLKQYELVRNERVLKHLFSFSQMYLNNNQLIEMLEYLKKWPGISVDLVLDFCNGRAHAVNINVTPSGELKYYDSNNRKRLAPFKNTRHLASYIRQTVFNQFDPGAQVNIGFNAFKFYNSPREVPELERPIAFFAPESSANNFSALHYAVLENNLERIHSLLKENPREALRKDRHGYTPLALAMKFKNWPCIHALWSEKMNTADLDFNDLVRLCREDFTFIQDLFLKGILTTRSIDKNGRSLLHAAIAEDHPDLSLWLLNRKDIDVNIPIPKEYRYAHWTPLMYVMAHDAPARVVNALLAHKDLRVNAHNLEDETALNIAAEFQSANATLERLVSHPRLIIRDELLLGYVLRNIKNKKILRTVIDNNERIAEKLLDYAMEQNQPDVIMLLLDTCPGKFFHKSAKIFSYALENHHMALCRLSIRRLPIHLKSSINLCALPKSDRSLIFSRKNRTSPITYRDTSLGRRPFILV